MEVVAIMECDACSIVMDGWTNCQNCPLLNMTISSTFSPYFQRVINCFGQMKNTIFLKDQLCEAIVEVVPLNVAKLSQI